MALIPINNNVEVCAQHSSFSGRYNAGCPSRSGAACSHEELLLLNPCSVTLPALQRAPASVGQGRCWSEPFQSTLPDPEMYKPLRHSKQNVIRRYQTQNSGDMNPTTGQNTHRSRQMLWSLCVLTSKDGLWAIFPVSSAKFWPHPGWPGFGGAAAFRGPEKRL